MKRFSFSKKALPALFLFLLLSFAAIIFSANSEIIEKLLPKIGIPSISVFLGLLIPYSMLLTVKKALN